MATEEKKGIAIAAYQALHLLDEDGNHQDTFNLYDTDYTSVDVDSAGNFVVGGEDDSVVKLGPDGSEQWRITGITGGGWIRGIAIDSNDYVYAGGDYALALIDPSGNILWTEDTSSSYFYNDALEVFSNDEVGTTSDSVRRYDVNGTQQWESQVTGGTMIDLEIDKNDNLYVPCYDDYVYKLDSGGNSVWTAGPMGDQGLSVGLDTSGNVYGGENFGRLWKWDSGGNKQWDIDVGSDPEAIEGLSNGNILVVAWSWVRAYNPSGNQVWENYDYGGNKAALYTSLAYVDFWTNEHSCREIIP